MLIGSRRFYSVGFAALSAVVAITLSGCAVSSSGSQSPCDVGAEDAPDALLGFLAAVQRDSKDDAQKFLDPGGQIPVDQWDALNEQLGETTFDNWTISVEQMGSGRSLSATKPDGTKLEPFQAAFADEAPNCTTIVWGTYPTDPDADASQPAGLG